MAFEIEHGVLKKYIPENGETEVVIPEGVTSIGERAFYDCESLTSITIPEGVTSIGEMAFQWCSSLTSVMIPKSVTSIDSYVFLGTPWLKNYTGDLVIINDILLKYRGTDAHVTIPEGVTRIGKEAFYECKSLTSITIPEGVTSIGEKAFCECISLTSVTIPESVTSISSCVFLGTPWLENYPGDLVIINDILLKYKGTDAHVTIPEGVTRIDWAAFSECESLTSVTIPEGVTEIGGGAFSECKRLTSVTIPEGVTEIEYCAFSGCESLTSVTIPEGVTEIGYCAFRGCESLTSVTIPRRVASIEDYAFCECKSLTSVTILEGVREIGDHAFNGCSSLTSVTIPEGVTEIGYCAFSDCESLTSVTIPESVTYIGDDAFCGCRSIRMFGIAFAPKVFKESDYGNAREMLETRDFSMKLNADIKYAAAVSFWMKTEDEAAEAFIKKSISRIMAFLIENGNADAIGKILESGKFITKKNIDKFITSAIEHTQNGGSPEIQTMLMHHKAEVLGYSDPNAQFRL